MEFDKRDPVDEVEAALVRIRRRQTKRTLARLAAMHADQLDLSLMGVIDAVEEGGSPAVGEVGERLGLDPSRASRLVAAAVEAGYVRRVASQADGRRVTLELTDAGRERAAATHRFRQAMFGRAMADWTPEERDTFARLLTRFTDALDAAVSPASGE